MVSAFEMDRVEREDRDGDGVLVLLIFVCCVRCEMDDCGLDEDRLVELSGEQPATGCFSCISVAEKLCAALFLLLLRLFIVLNEVDRDLLLLMLLACC